VADAIPFDFVYFGCIPYRYSRAATVRLYWAYIFCLGFVLWMYLEVDRKLASRGAELFVIVLRIKSVEEMCLSPTRSRTYVSHISGSNGPVMNVGQRKLGTINSDCPYPPA
jgi:hypothetical protein